MKRGLKVLIAIFAVLVIISVAFLLMVGLKSEITVSKIDNAAKDASDDVVKNATPIVVNNVIVGAVYNKAWVAPESYYFRNTNKTPEIDIYNTEGKKGKFKITEQAKDTGGAGVYAKTNNPDTASEFFGIAAGSGNVMLNPATKQLNITEADVKRAKEALGFYRIFNSSLKIESMYDVTFDSTHRGQIVCVTNEVGKSQGLYSAVIYLADNGDKSLIKYSYIKDKKNASEWPVYTFKFVADLNQDGVNDLVIQETKEFDVGYDVIEYRDGNFTEVLSTSVKLKQ